MIDKWTCRIKSRTNIQQTNFFCIVHQERIENNLSEINQSNNKALNLFVGFSLSRNRSKFKQDKKRINNKLRRIKKLKTNWMSQRSK